MSESPSWNRALTLSERDSFFPEEPPPGFDPELAQRRVDRWCRESRLGNGYLELRLRQQGLDPQRFERILGSPPPTPKSLPGWLVELRRAYATSEASRAPEGLWRSAVAERADAVFLPVVTPLLDRGWCRLEKRLSTLPWPSEGSLTRKRFAKLWAAPLADQFLQMISRVLILELYVARLEGRLEGETPEDRFDSFVAGLKSEAGALNLYAQYPVLARSLVNRQRQWLDCGVELARRLLEDLPALAQTFGENRPLGDLATLTPGLGDRHHDGRTVAALGFESGTRVIYKPRSLALDVAFQELVAWLGEQGIEPRLRTLRVLDRGTHGWVETVEQAPCRDGAELDRFFARQGVLLALLYALEATDFHHENLIAAGEHPVLIDLETLFQPVLADSETERERLNPVYTTILRSGLLPRGKRGADGDVDLSGLGAVEGQVRPVLDLVRAGTDTMGFSDAMRAFEVGKHLLVLDGRTVPFQGHARRIEESFERTYRRLMSLRPALLDRLDRFAGLETRVVVRPTNVYSHLGYRSFHPDHLQDSIHRERLFDKLWLDADLLTWMPSAIPAERRDLMRGDVPLFRTHTDSRSLLGHGLRLDDAFPESGLHLARRRIESLSEDDLERQRTIFRLSLASTRRLDEIHADDARALRPLPKPAGPPESRQLIEQATRIGERLHTLAFHAQDWISWYHLAPSFDGSQSLQPVGHDLYSGLGGIALFFAQLGRVTGAPRWQALARRAMSTAQERFERQSTDGSLSLGGYSGLGGWIYSSTYLGALWREPEFLDAAEVAREQVVPAVPDDQGLDLIAGSAGCLVALLELHRHRPCEATLAAAVACGDHLLDRAETHGEGLAWTLPSIAELPLTGFAHGTAGIAWALGRLAGAGGGSRFADGARAALGYERGLFSPEHDNWPDLRADRSQDGEWAFFHAWCHGAPGIGLARLASLEVRTLLGPAGEGFEEEIHAATRSTLALGFGGSQCLCHGDLGNLELLLRAGRQLDDPELTQRAWELAGQIVRGLERDGPRCGLSSPVEIPGLMTGLAGIGYGLLQLADEAVPSVLTLETPASS